MTRRKEFEKSLSSIEEYLKKVEITESIKRAHSYFLSTKIQIPKDVIERASSEMFKTITQEIVKFQTKGYNKSFFRQSSRKMVLNTPLVFTRDPIKHPVISLSNRKMHKVARAAFKNLMMYMGDWELSSAFSSRDDAITSNLKLAIRYPHLRDELYLQVAKQLHKNPREESKKRGTMALCLYARTFPASREFEGEILAILFEIKNRLPEYEDYTKFALRNFRKKNQSFTEKSIPNESFIRDIEEIPTGPLMFMRTVKEIIDYQRKHEDEMKKDMVLERVYDEKNQCYLDNDDIEIPRVLTFLIRGLKRNGGLRTEGIFRKPGGVKRMEELREEIDRGIYNESDTNPFTYSSLIKEWLRELEEPVIPDSLVDKMLSMSSKESSEYFRSGEFERDLPKENLSVIRKLCEFFNELLKKENQEKTRMDPTNLSIVMSPNIFATGDASDPSALSQLAAKTERSRTLFIKMLDAFKKEE